MSSFGIRRFTPEDYSEVMNDVISKILKMNCNFVIFSVNSETVPQYERLLRRAEYHVDYGNIFINRSMNIHVEGNAFLKKMLNV